MRITEAEAAFRVQNYARVVELLQPIANHPRIVGSAAQRQIFEWLGTSHWFDGAHDAARLVYTNLIRRWPDHRLNRLVYPAELINFYDTRRQDLINLGVIKRDTREYVVREIVIDDTPWPVYFAPFGIGQFANHEPGKGTVIAILQGLGLATTIATWFAIEDLKVGDTNNILENHDAEVRVLNITYFAGLGLFLASYGFSVVDGFLQRPPTRRTKLRREYFDADDFEDVPPPAINLTPAASGVGLGLDVTF